MSSKRKLIEVLDEKSASEKEESSQKSEEVSEDGLDLAELLGEEDDSEEEDEDQEADNGKEKEPPKPSKSEPKGASKDLLRLEKDYFDGIYNEKNAKNEKEFLVKKMLVDQKPKEKPKFEDIDNSSSTSFSFILII